MKNMKGPFVTGERNTDPGDFTVDALCKDSKLMERTSTKPLPAVAAAIERFEEQQEMGHGDQDFSSISSSATRAKATFVLTCELGFCRLIHRLKIFSINGVDTHLR
nr:hypothetical protein [Corynebacterium camporealensis]